MIKSDQDLNPSLGLADTKARSIIPVDLNCFLAASAEILSKFHSEVVGDEEKAEEYSNIQEDLNEAIDAVLWNEEDGSWYDFDLIHGCQRRFFTPSNLVPLWTESFLRSEQKEKAVEYLSNQMLENYPGGCT